MTEFVLNRLRDNMELSKVDGLLSGGFKFIRRHLP